MSAAAVAAIVVAAVVLSLVTVAAMLMQRAGVIPSPHSGSKNGGFTQHVLPAVALIAGLLLFPVFTIAWTSYTIIQQQHGWCRLLDDLTTTAPKQVPPPGPQATAEQRVEYRSWQIYRDLQEQKAAYRCG